MIGLAFGLIKMMLWSMCACIDFMFALCTLGKADPKTRRFF
ncbi:hypothetical protein AB0F36_28815 [Streptomyces sp. NPDC029080]